MTQQAQGETEALGRKLWQEHEQLTKRICAQLRGNMTWIWEWFREELPLEDAAGSSMYHLYRQGTSRGVQNFREDFQPKAAENVLVFPDSYGFCNNILNYAPEGRLGKQLVVSKPPEALTQKELRNFLLEDKWDLVIFGYSIDIPDEVTVEAITAKQDAVARALFWLGQECAKDSKIVVKRLAVLTADNFAEDAAIHEECGVALTTNATVFGMVNTMRQELPMIPMQYIDVEWSLMDERMPYLASDIFRIDTFGRKALRILNKGRYVGGFMKVADYNIGGQDFEGKFVLPENGIIAITGGNGALGLVMGRWFLEQAEKAHKAGRPVKFTLQFLSRSMKVSEQNMPNWEAIQDKAAKLGIRAEHAKMDAGDRDSVVRYLEEATPDLAGIVHSAGILKDGMLAGQTWQNFSDVYDAKNRGALYIHFALEMLAEKNPNFSFYWLFSSAAVYGSMGQVNYSGSNSYNDCLARHRRALKKPITVMQWGAWGEVGMATNLDEKSKARMEQGPMPPFSTADGLRGMEDGLATGLPYYLVMGMNMPVMASSLLDDSKPVTQYMQLCYSKAFSIAPPTNGTIDEANIYKYLCYEGRNAVLNPQGEEDRLVYKAYVQKFKENQ